MPFKSKSQQRFMFAKHPKMAEEFADKTPDMKALPEKAPKNMAFGGETNPKKETVKSMENNPTAGFADGGEVKPTMGDENPILAFLRQKLMSNNAPITAEQNEVNQALGIDQPNINTSDGHFMGNLTANTTSVPNMAVGGDIMDAFKGAAGSMAAPIQGIGSALMGMNPLNALAEHMAVGGVNQQLNPSANPMQPTPPPPTSGVDQGFIDQLNKGINTGPVPGSQPPVNPISQTMNKVNTLPSTPPSIYQGMTSEDRANLMNQLIAQKHSGGNLIASGAAGLGDAIARSFGGQNTNYQQNLENNQNKNIEQRVGVMDTQRTQKLQDLQANMATLEADPNSTYSQGMRQFFKVNGIPVPSGMSAGMLKGLLPDMAKIFEAKLTAGSAHEGHIVESAKGLMGESFLDEIRKSMGMTGPEQGETALEGVVGGTGGKPVNFTHQTPSGIKYGVH